MNSAALRELETLLGANAVVSSHADLMVYECDAFVAAKNRPVAVAFPDTTEKVARAVKWANKHNVTVVPRGAGTGLAGGALPETNSLLISTSRLNQIVEMDIPNRRALVEAGVVNVHLTQAAAPFGFCFAPDPSSQAACTIGGNIAANSGGPHTLKYGITVNHTLGVELVTPDGEIVWLGGGLEGAPGFDLLGAVVGSEGTLGIVTRAWVKLVRAPQKAHTMLAIFDDFDAGAQCVAQIIGAGIVPAALEMLDDVFLPAIEAAYKFGLPLDAKAILLIETDGLEAASAEEYERAAQICRDCGAREVRLARDDKERKLLWAARKGAFGAVGRITPSYVTQDGVVPRSKLTEILAIIKEVGLKHNVTIANVFHAGDGNLHPCVFYDERDVSQLPRVLEAGEEILKHCIDMGGSATGEHGTGIEKVGLMEYAFNADTIAAMRDFKDVFNPNGRFNPSKLLPSASGCVEIGQAFKNAETAARAASPFAKSFVRRGVPL